MKSYDLNDTPAAQSRRPQNAMDDDWISAFLAQAPVGRIATHWDNQPFVLPTSFVFNPQHRRIYFHSNIVGRIRANAERFPEVCFEADRAGEFLPSNSALEFTVQYESVIAFGHVRIVEDETEAKAALEALIAKHFPDRQPGRDYRPITEKELARTSVYAIEIESWSGKRNWPEQAKQIEWASEASITD